MGSRSTPSRSPKSRFRLKSWTEWFAAAARRGASSPQTPPLAAYRIDLALSAERSERWLASSPLARWVIDRPKAHAEAARKEIELPTLSVSAETTEANEAALCDALSALFLPLALPAYDDETRHDRLEAIAVLAQLATCDDTQMSPLAAARDVILGIELPLLAASSLPECKLAKSLATLGAKHARTFLDERFDGGGMIDGKLAAEYASIAASLLRCAAIVRDLPTNRTERKWYNADRRHQIEMLAWQFWRMLRADGTLTLPDIYGRVPVGPAIEFASGLARDPEEAEALHRIASRLRKGKPEKRSGTLIVEPMCYSGWAEHVVLRASEKQAARFVASYAEGRYVAELLDRGEPILTGPIDTTIRLDGHVLAQDGDWQEVCWHSDDDGDYLELEASFDRGLRIQRQVYLDRQEQIFLFADAVLLEAPGELEYDVRWTCAPKIMVQQFDETSELLLDGPATATTFFPLAAAEWRDAPSPCRVQVESTPAGEALRMTWRGRGEAAFVPWCFHFTNSRRGIPVTWRRLTVAEDRQVMPTDSAVGYRVQVGDDQWLLYRSLDGLGNRTLMGHNLVSEFFLARFLEDGTVEKMLELQPDEEG